MQSIPLGSGMRIGEFSVVSNAAPSQNRVPLYAQGCWVFSQTTSRLYTTLCDNYRFCPLNNKLRRTVA